MMFFRKYELTYEMKAWLAKRADRLLAYVGLFLLGGLAGLAAAALLLPKLESAVAEAWCSPPKGKMAMISWSGDTPTCVQLDDTLQSRRRFFQAVVA
jgi:hypothetical protein